MPNAKVMFHVEGNPPFVTPPEVPVTKGTEDGVEWKIDKPGYTFRGVAIDVGPDLTDDFGDVVIGTYGGDNRSIMTITDALTLPKDKEIVYKYTIRYVKDSDPNTKLFLDPTIRNRG